MDLDKSTPVAEEKVVAGNPLHPSDHKKCLNCDTPLNGKYCHQCGQRDLAKRQSLGDLLQNFISSFWSYESKFFVTGKLLLFKPARLALDYNEGKRERYYHPARMYVFISFVYFLLLTTLPDKDDTNFNIKSSDQEMAKETAEISSNGLPVGKYKSKAQYDSAQNALPEEKRDGFLERRIRIKGIELNEKYKDNGDQLSADFSQNFLDNSPKVFFLLLPVFALVFKLLYVRRDFFYSEHLVFSIYYYNFFFLAGSVYMLMEQVPYLDYLSWIVILWIVVYLLIAMKKMYKQSWGKTILKYCTFVFIFSLCILIGLGINLSLTLMYL